MFAKQIEGSAIIFCVYQGANYENNYPLYWNPVLNNAIRTEAEILSSAGGVTYKSCTEAINLTITQDETGAAVATTGTEGLAVAGESVDGEADAANTTSNTSTARMTRPHHFSADPRPWNLPNKDYANHNYSSPSGMDYSSLPVAPVIESHHIHHGYNGSGTNLVVPLGQRPPQHHGSYHLARNTSYSSEGWQGFSRTLRRTKRRR